MKKAVEQIKLSEQPEQQRQWEAFFLVLFPLNARQTYSNSNNYRQD